MVVYGTFMYFYNYSYWGESKPTNNSGAPHPMGSHRLSYGATIQIIHVRIFHFSDTYGLWKNHSPKKGIYILIPSINWKPHGFPRFPSPVNLPLSPGFRTLSATRLGRAEPRTRSLMARCV